MAANVRLMSEEKARTRGIIEQLRVAQRMGIEEISIDTAIKLAESLEHALNRHIAFHDEVQSDLSDLRDIVRRGPWR